MSLLRALLDIGERRFVRLRALQRGEPMMIASHGAPDVAQRTVAVLPASVLEQRLSLAQVGAQAVVAVGGRWRGHGSEGGCRQLRTPRRQQGLLGRVGQALGLAVGIAEDALHPRISVVEQLAVHPLEVQRQPQGLAHAHVLEQLAPGVEHVALKARWQAVPELDLDQLAGIELFAGDAPRPVAS